MCHLVSGRQSFFNGLFLLGEFSLFKSNMEYKRKFHHRPGQKSLLCFCIKTCLVMEVDSLGTMRFTIIYSLCRLKKGPPLWSQVLFLLHQDLTSSYNYLDDITCYFVGLITPVIHQGLFLFFFLLEHLLGLICHLSSF